MHSVRHFLPAAALSVKAQGGDVRMVYSPLEAVKLAQQHPDRQVVFFAVGFETTAPANAMAVWQAHQLGLENFSILCSHVLVPLHLIGVQPADLSIGIGLSATVSDTMPQVLERATDLVCGWSVTGACSNV